MNCYHHYDRLAFYRCTTCQRNFCEECIKVRSVNAQFTAYICKMCGQKVEPIVKTREKTFPKFRRLKEKGEKQISTIQGGGSGKGQEGRPVSSDLSERSFIRNLWDIFCFPLRGRGILLAGMFALLFYICDWVIRYHIFLGTLFLVITATYFFVFLFQIMENTMHGSYDVEGVPDLAYWKGVVKPAVCLGLVIWFCFGPANIYFLMTRDLDFFYVLLLGFGFLFLPMFLIRTVVLRDFRVLHVLKVLVAIRNTIIPYGLMISICLGLFLVKFFVNTEYLAGMEKFGLTLSFLVNVYISLVLVRLMGLFARKFGGIISA